MGIFGLKDALGGTLRQLLAVSQSVNFLNTDFVDLGSLSWSYDSATSVFFSINLSGATVAGACLSSKYVRGTTGTFANMNNGEIFISGAYSPNCVAIKDTSYTNVTAFKNAMKGVLLAYEKA